MSDQRSAPQERASDRRTLNRARSTMAADCSGSTGKDRHMFAAAVRDISPEGIGLGFHYELESEDPPGEGAMLAVTLLDPADRVRMLKWVRVTHRRQEGPGHWFVGGRFLFRLRGEDVQTLL